MNLTNNRKIENSIVEVNKNLQALFMGILLIAATFSLLASNTIATAAFAQTGSMVVGCANTVKVTIINLPGQTNKSDTQVVLSNGGPNQDKGEANIDIPGIGSGQLLVTYNLNQNKYVSLISNIPNQNGPSMSDAISEANVCTSASPTFVSLYIPGLPAAGSISITKIN